MKATYNSNKETIEVEMNVNEFINLYIKSNPSAKPEKVLEAMMNIQCRIGSIPVDFTAIGMEMEVMKYAY